MFSVDPHALARVAMEDRLREANHLRLARELRRGERSAVAPTAPREPRHRSRLRSLVRFGHAYG